VPDREELLDRDPKTSIAYPKELAKRLQRTKLGSWRYWRGAFVIVLGAVDWEYLVMMTGASLVRGGAVRALKKVIEYLFSFLFCDGVRFEHTQY
jgi:hypothetical protein